MHACVVCTIVPAGTIVSYIVLIVHSFKICHWNIIFFLFNKSVIILGRGALYSAIRKSRSREMLPMIEAPQPINTLRCCRLWGAVLPTVGCRNADWTRCLP